MGRVEGVPDAESPAVYRVPGEVLVRELPHQIRMYRMGPGPGDGTSIVIEGAGVLLLRLAVMAPTEEAIESAIVAHMGEARRDEAIGFLERLVDQGVLTRG